MRVLVCTVVHHPEDARILHRQIRALLDAGHEVVYAAPFTDCRVTPWSEVTPVDLPRSADRRRARALRAARRALNRHAGDADLMLLHDPELLLTLPLTRRLPPVAWDVHEDTAAALVTKDWIPRPLRRALGPLVRAAEALAERRLHLLLAEEGYQERFRRPHPVVPNSTYVPDQVSPPGETRVVYVGQLSRVRGVHEMIDLAGKLRERDLVVELVGTADPETRGLLGRANLGGVLRWHGFVPNDQAMRLVEGSLAGLSLLHDAANYRHSQPTKIIEYMARGIPIVTTPNPVAAGIVLARECGFVVPFGDTDAAAEAILRLRDDPALRTEMGGRGHRAAQELFSWPHDAVTFVKQLEEWANTPRPASQSR
ncbi:MAG: glycosyltransferase [Streptosporangiales bacterium]|nr:glycosyltransferase [Streptosporangiales bacterium]